MHELPFQHHPHISYIYQKHWCSSLKTQQLLLHDQTLQKKIYKFADNSCYLQLHFLIIAASLARVSSVQQAQAADPLILMHFVVVVLK